jgi:hypothetical protein
LWRNPGRNASRKSWRCRSWRVYTPGLARLPEWAAILAKVNPFQELYACAPR